MAFGSSFLAGAQARNLGRDRQLKEQQIAAQEQQTLATQVNDQITKNFEVLSETIMTLDQQGIPRTDQRYQQAVKPIADATLSLAQKAQMRNIQGIDPTLIKQRIENALQSPTPDQVLEQQAKEKETLKAAETRGTQSETTPDTKQVWDKTQGQLVFATDKQIAENPQRFVPYEAPKQAGPAQLKTAINPKTGETINAVFRPDDPTNVTTIDGKPLPEGFVMASAQVTGSPADFTSKTQGALEEDIVAGEDTLADLTRLQSTFRPEFLTLPFKAGVAISNIIEGLGGEISEDQKAAVRDYSEFTQTAFKVMNQTIKEMTGAQMSELEANRLRKQIPDPEKDKPTQYKTKMDGVTEQTKLANARKRYMLKNGIQHDFSEGDPPISLDKMKGIINARGQELIDAGVPRPQAVARVRAEFGL